MRVVLLLALVAVVACAGRAAAVPSLRGGAAALDAAAAAAAADTAPRDSAWYTAEKVDGQWEVLKGKSGAAYGTFQDDLATTGWAHLRVFTDPNTADADSMYAAGFLEGALTAHRITQHWPNFLSEQGPGLKKAWSLVMDFIAANNKWMDGQVAALSATDPYWAHVGLVLAQVRGMCDGYNRAAGAADARSFAECVLMQLDGDLEDLLPAVDKTQRVDFTTLSAHDAHAMRAINRTHCSSLVRVTGDLTDMFASHTTWSSYSEMLRVWKEYSFDLQTPGVAAKTVVFSGYYAQVPSIDDFFSTSAGMTVMETTNSIYNLTLYDAVTPETVLYWIRSAVANRMASNGAEWTELFARYNSGTYNNQWIIVDYKLFEPGHPLQPGTLWITEQIPGYMHAGDVTSYLALGHWPSFNIPFFSDIWLRSGYKPLFEKFGNEYSHDLCPRAKIFRRDAGKVETFEDFQAIMRYNDYKNDPYSGGDPGNAIASRFDLEPQSEATWGAFGAVDCKMTNVALMTSLQAKIISGPTQSHGIPPFTWSDKFPDAHVGDPTTFDFPWITTAPVTE